MNRPIRRVAVAAMAMFTALLLNLSYTYLVRADSLNDNPLNRRVQDARFAQDRGPILVGNTAVASSEQSKGRFAYLRSYAQPRVYAPVTGFYSYLYGSSALESSRSAQLAGTDDSQFLDRLVNMATGRTPQGGTVETTLDAKAQQAAWDGLAGRKGAVVAIDTSTGAIRALVSAPSYDPNLLSSHDLDASTRAWTELQADPDKPMANRATREIYAPGSTFKLVTAATALENGMTADDTVDGTSYRLPGSSKVIEGSCGQKITLTRALEVSCNPAFARLGADLGQDALRTQAERFGFGTTLLPDIGSVASVFPEELDKAQTAMSAIGAYDVAATPLQMALVAAAVDNGGVVMEPYIVQRVLSADLSVVSETHPQQLSQAISESTAKELRSMMIGVVQSGTGTPAQVPGLTVGGKTGTAAATGRLPYAWFVAFADELDLAVAVLVEDAGVSADEVYGSRYAAPIAKAVIEAMR